MAKTIQNSEEQDEFAFSEHKRHDFCFDMTCPCHEDQENISDLGEAYQDGLVSASDADNIYRGKVV